MSNAGKGKIERKWQSDMIVDLIKRYNFPYITMNPGASFRGLHDSIINYGENEPPMLLCQHEEIAVQIAHGYSKATFGKPMLVILHNLVGLLHATMAIYYAFIDRAPIFIVGATGPMHEGKRRPDIDWKHTALVQGEVIRQYTKWDYQPHAIDGVPESFARAYSIMLTEPHGPVYMCYDAAMQEEPITYEVPQPPIGSVDVPAPTMPNPEALEAIADKMVASDNPVLLAQYVGRHEGGFENLVELAETIGSPVWDANSSLNFPNRHPLCVTFDKSIFETADLIVGLDVRDWEKQTHRFSVTERGNLTGPPASCDHVEVGFAEVGISKWAMDYGRMQPCSVRALGDTKLGIPELTRLICQRIEGNAAAQEKIAKRKGAVAKRHDGLFAKWDAEARVGYDSVPMTPQRLALEMWDVIKDEDWVLTANTLKYWVRKLWNFDKAYRHPGQDIGTSTQVGISLGVGLANKGTGRLVVDIQPDGDLMFDAGALWFAAKHEIPMLFVMYNNRAYYNDWDHQIHLAHERDTDEAKAHIGMDLFGPDPDFAGLARSMGVWGEGPIEKGEDLGPELRRAIEVVKSGKPALVDAVTSRITQKAFHA
jgi:acetolactate synthase-1/2/3 large subunit